MKFFKLLAETLFPAYFAFVMATGALSISSFFLGFELLADVLLYLNVAAFAVLWGLTGIRLANYPKRLLADLTSHSVGPGFFTTVAATCVLGSQLIVVTGSDAAAFYLWIAGIFLWFIIMYTFFTAVTVRRNKPSLLEGINGAWLIAAVATQSVSILGIMLFPHLENNGDALVFFAVCMHFLGCMLYLTIIALIFYRFTFLRLAFAELTPPYWINMGAVAITSLAGATLILHVDDSPLLLEISPFLKGFTLFFWAGGTWWIPLLFILTYWRHAYHRYPFSYGPQWWAMVFPLAMYTASTWELAVALDLPFLKAIPRAMFYISLISWILVFVGMLRHVYFRWMKFYRTERIQKKNSQPSQ